MLQSLRLCLRYETEVLRGFTNESQLDLGCFKATGENKEAAHWGFYLLSGFDSQKKVRSHPGKLLADDAVFFLFFFVRLVEKQYVLFYFIVLEMAELWHYNVFFSKRIICWRRGTGGSTAFSPIKSLCFKVQKLLHQSRRKSSRKKKKKKAQAQFRHEAPVQRLQCGILKVMSVVFNARYKASKDSLCLVCLICLICSRKCVFTVEPVTVFIVWLL